MPFNYDSTGIQEHTARPLLPEGQYSMAIIDAVEGTSKAGNPMAILDVKVIEDVDHQGFDMKHWVVFLPPEAKGANMNVHFRKCIGVPYEGAVEVNPVKWIGKKFKAKVSVETVQGEKGMYQTNKIKAVFPYGDIFPPVETSQEEVPF